MARKMKSENGKPMPMTEEGIQEYAEKLEEQKKDNKGGELEE